MKKGFTLIELLAVIVILAIIALIATPIILGIIEDARKGSIEASANGYIDAVEYQVARNEIKGSEISSGVYDVTELDVDIDGEKPTSGTITINKGNVVDATLKINNQTVYYDGTIAKVIDLYTDVILNGADPQIKGELIPVNIASDGTVTKADITKAWYNYEDKEWANAVILFDGKSYKVGEEIPEESIKEYYVWIPKYAYRLWNVNSDNLDNVEKPIEIVFGSKAKTTGKTNGDMYVHPAFKNFNTQGIWVGKFELSYNEETYTNKDLFLKTNPNLNKEQTSNFKGLLIKPNVRSYGGKTVGGFYTILREMHPNLNSHMITNMEWGAAAYLTYSIYGRCNDNTCTKITSNNINTGWFGSSPIFTGQVEWGSTITGCAADNIADGNNALKNLDNINTYETEKGVLASTTGNITGIYDMSGGNYENVMALSVRSDGTIISGHNNIFNSGFKGIYGCPGCNGDTSGLTENTTGLEIPDKKYYTAYINDDPIASDMWYKYDAGLLGDATKEIANTKTSATNNMGNWFQIHAIFATVDRPTLYRGGCSVAAANSDILTFNRGYGNQGYSYATRAVLAF